jgi:hypothetical protein
MDFDKVTLAVIARFDRMVVRLILAISPLVDVPLSWAMRFFWWYVFLQVFLIGMGVVVYVLRSLVWLGGTS